MGVGVSVLADRFRQEPLSLLEYDRAMDGEGLLDASAACRAAWREFGPVWRADRAEALARSSGQAAMADLLSVDDAWARYGMVRLREWCAWFGMCPRSSGVRYPSPALVGAGFRVRERVLRADPDLFDAIGRLFGGEILALVAGDLGREPGHLRSQVVQVSKWLRSELQVGDGYGFPIG